MAPADAGQFEIADAPSTLNWGTEFDAERITETEYTNENTVTFMNSATNAINTLHDRVNALDDRERLDHNETQQVTLLNANNSIDGTTDQAFSSQPGIQATAEHAGFPIGLCVDVAATANADNTWDFTVHAAASPAATGVGGDVPINCDIKGPVSEDTNLDP
jgi:hypothetical protein